jgi:hypothetical protein
MSSYYNTPQFEKLKQQARKGVIFTGQDITFICFSNYSDASLCARSLSLCGEEAGTVRQMIFDEKSFRQVGDPYGLLIKRGERPQEVPAGQFSLFTVPIFMSPKKVSKMFPEMVAEGHVVSITAPNEEIAAAIRNLRGGHAPSR